MPEERFATGSSPGAQHLPRRNLEEISKLGVWKEAFPPSFPSWSWEFAPTTLHLLMLPSMDLSSQCQWRGGVGGCAPFFLVPPFSYFFGSKIPRSPEGVQVERMVSSPPSPNPWPGPE
ncbi:Hypothetical predicted protein [Podarcis lilfordi]|uniref:Uncharacterized protein n=1 Tax=Podarcis lilfordi TaxID=74358 RepID=A0AA35LK39_9SAUR|nr:Hypothetical predicted protein [Podarcis lilfordi]